MKFAAEGSKSAAQAGAVTAGAGETTVTAGTGDARGASGDEGQAAALDVGVEADLLELVRLMPPVVRGLKRQAAARRPAGLEPLREMLAAGSLGPRHLPVIVVLAFEGSVTVSELARRIGLGTAATSLMVGELARAGIVEREIDEHDRRRTFVRIATPLQQECVAFARERLAPMRRALERMEPATRTHFIAGWRVLAQEAGGTAGPDGGTARPDVGTDEPDDGGTDGPDVGSDGPDGGAAGPELCDAVGLAPAPAGSAGACAGAT